MDIPKVIVTHKNCSDGSCVAIIAKNAFPDIEILFIEHGQEQLDLKPRPGMIFIDIAPHPSKVIDFVEVGAFCLDHHASSRDIVEQFGARGIFADEKEDIGISGGLLAHEFFKDFILRNKRDLSKRAAILTGIRDCWVKTSPDWETACRLADTISFYPQDHFKTHYDIGKIFALAEEIGPILVEKKKGDVLVAQKNGYITKVFKYNSEEVIPVFITDRKDLVSDLSEQIPEPLCFGFGYSFADNPSLTVSCRSKSDFDVGKLSKFYGGGGHSKAAGFKIELNENNESPQSLIEKYINDYIVFSGAHKK